MEREITYLRRGAKLSCSGIYQYILIGIDNNNQLIGANIDNTKRSAITSNNKLWCKEVEKTISLPTLLSVDKNNFVKTDVSAIQLHFSEEMNTQSPFEIQIVEYRNWTQTGRDTFLKITDCIWSNNGKTVHFKIDTDYTEFLLLFNWWGNHTPLVSKNGIFLRPQSYVLLSQ